MTGTKWSDASGSTSGSVLVTVVDQANAMSSPPRAHHVGDRSGTMQRRQRLDDHWRVHSVESHERRRTVDEGYS